MKNKKIQTQKKKPVLIMYPDPYGSHSTIRIQRTTAKKISDLCVCICVRENICISFMIFYIFLTYSTSIDYLKEHWSLKRSEVDSGKFLKLSQISKINPYFSTMCAHETVRTITSIECYLGVCMFIYLDWIWKKLTKLAVRIEMEANTLVQWYRSITSLVLNFTTGV